MGIYSKLADAKKKIRNTEMKKGGYNSYSEYAYFTPAQVETLVEGVCDELKIITIFDLKRNDLGETGYLTVVDIETGEKHVYEMATAIPVIKATNLAQQLGGCVTYTERYLKMSAFGIVDNSLDLDTTENTTKSQQQPKSDLTPDGKEKTWLNKTDKEGNVLESYQKVVKSAKEKGMSAKDLRHYYKINKAVFPLLESDLES